MDKQNRKYIAEYEDLMQEWDWEANTDLDPNKVTYGSHKKAWWKCPKCGYKWQQSIIELTRKVRPAHCPNCTSRVVVKGINDFATFYPDDAKEWHPTKNGDLKPDMVTKQSDKLVWWLCPKCGKDWQTKVRSKRGCPHCLHKPIVGKDDLATLYPEIAKEWHPTKNGNLTPKDVKQYSNKKIWWLCPNNHEYQARIGERTRAFKGTNCPICNRQNRTSFPEQAIFYYIKKVFPDAISGYRAKFLGKMELDIFIPKYAIGIEYDGEFWHKQEKESIEKKKYNLCKKNGIHLIRFKEGKKRDYSELADECYFISENAKNNNLLERCIIYVLNSLDFSYEKMFGNKIFYKSYDVDIKRDEIKIRECYQTKIKNSIAETHPRLIKDWHSTKNGLLTPYNCHIGSNYKVWWKCSKCGYEWQASPNKRCIRGHGCLNCSKQAPLIGVNDLATLYPEIAKEWHPTKNGNIKPTDIRPKSNRVYWWKCQKCGYEWQASGNNRIGHKSGCPACAGRTPKIGENDLFTVYPHLREEWDSELNKEINPETLPIGSRTKVWWKCSKCGHQWQTEVRQRVKGLGKCPHCKKFSEKQLRLL